MVHPSVEAGLMKGVRHAAARASSSATAAAAAVALAPIARLADRERHPAPAAQQQVQNDLHHQALAHVIRPREEWTGERGGAILLPLTSYPSCPGGSNPPGLLSFAGATIPHINRTDDAASPRMMMGGRSVGRPHVRIPRFSTAVHTWCDLPQAAGGWEGIG